MNASSPCAEGVVLDLEALLQERFSARRFLDRPVAEETILRVLELAQRTPSWCNTQPWTLHLVRGAATATLAARLGDRARSGAPATPDFAFPDSYAGVYRERRRECGVALYQALGIGREDRAKAAEQSMENFCFFRAPQVAIITTPKALGIYGAVDCGLYLHAWMLAARGLGLDTVAQAALASYPDILRSFLGVSDEERVVCGLAFGYADHAHPVNGYRTTRVSVAQSVRWVDTPADGAAGALPQG